MKYLKTFESWSVNETLDMFTMPVDPMEGAFKYYDSFYKEMKVKSEKFFKALKNEGKETQEAFDLVVRASKDEIELTDKQIDSIWKQLGDILKGIGLGVISLVPGSFIIFMLIKFFKLEKAVIPSSFQ